MNISTRLGSFKIDFDYFLAQSKRFLVSHQQERKNSIFPAFFGIDFTLRLEII
jgi:hypothetical protein